MSNSPITPAPSRDWLPLAFLRHCAADFLLFLLLLAAPWLTFAEGNRLLLEPLNAAMIAVLAIIAAAMAGLLYLWPSAILRAAFIALLVLVLIDFQFDIQDTRPAWFAVLAGPLTGEKAFPLVAAGLFLIAWLLRSILRPVLTAMAGVSVISTLAMAGWNIAANPARQSSGAKAAENSRLPVYVHIVLDEHIGLAALNQTNSDTDTIQQDIARFYTGNGFRLFSRAFSQFYYTRDSFAAFLNSHNEGKPQQFIADVHNAPLRANVRYKYRLTQNLYFDKLAAKGYALRVYQTNWLDLCGHGSAKIAQCSTYPYSLNDAALKQFSQAERFRIAVATYAKLSFLAVKLHELAAGANTNADHSHEGETTFATWRAWLGPPVSFPAIDSLIHDLKTAQRGEAYFAHLLLPHHPYTVDAQCAIRKPVVSTWKDLRDSSIKEPLFNTAQSRMERYKLYLPQIRCATRKLDEVFNALRQRNLLADATIILHGDHGSKLTIYEPIIENNALLGPQDLFDAFSTLFAIKAPGLDPGIDDKMAPLQTLLDHWLSNGMKDRLQNVDEGQKSVFVYDKKRGEKGGKMFALPMPDLPFTLER